MHKNRPLNRNNERQIRYYKANLMDQIAALRAQIESNLEQKLAIRHLQDLIQEREQHLGHIDSAPEPRRSDSLQASGLDSLPRMNPP